MKRILVLGLAFSLLQTSAAFAEESLLGSASRLAREAGARQAVVISQSESAARSELAVTSFAKAAGLGKSPVLAQQGSGGAGAISQTGLKARTKALIFVGAAVAFVGTAYGIDHRVKDVTPSSLGERHDNDVFSK